MRVNEKIGGEMSGCEGRKNGRQKERDMVKGGGGKRK